MSEALKYAKDVIADTESMVSRRRLWRLIPSLDRHNRTAFGVELVFSALGQKNVGAAGAFCRPVV